MAWKYFEKSLTTDNAANLYNDSDKALKWFTLWTNQEAFIAFEKEATADGNSAYRIPANGSLTAPEARQVGVLTERISVIRAASVTTRISGIGWV